MDKKRIIIIISVILAIAVICLGIVFIVKSNNKQVEATASNNVENYTLPTGEIEEIEKLKPEETEVGKILHVVEILVNEGVDFSKIELYKDGQLIKLKEIQQEGIDIQKIIDDNKLDGEYNLGERIQVLLSIYSITDEQKEKVNQLGLTNDNIIAITSPKPSPTPVDTTPKYYIKVNNTMNTVTIYGKDSSGNYTVPVKAMICSTGYASPHNTKVQLKSRWNWGGLKGDVYGQYCTHITGDFLFHSVPYLDRYNKNSLEWWAYDQLGTTCSAGCIRLTVADAQWIYYNCPAGTWCEFYSSSNPGPLGKPSAKKISNYPKYRGWDPTDPDANNPWRNFVQESPTPVAKPSPAVPTPSVVPSVTPTILPTVKPTASTIPSVKPSETPTPSVQKSPAPSVKPSPIQASPTPKVVTSPKVVTTPTGA